jgi:hypothetical protein
MSYAVMWPDSPRSQLAQLERGSALTVSRLQVDERVGRFRLRLLVRRRDESEGDLDRVHAGVPRM